MNPKNMAKKNSNMKILVFNFLSMIERLCSQKSRKPTSADHAQIESTKLQRPNSVISKFIQSVPDDLLLEIFLRLPNGLCVLQLATVCKRWHSLVVNPSIEKFASDFVQYHSRKQSLDSSYSPANTTSILLQYAEHTEQRCHQFSSETRPYSPKPFSCDGRTVRASCGDFLLLSRGIRQFFIYNPRTVQLITVPDLTNDEPQFVDRIYRGFAGFGLVVRDPKEGQASYRVVITEYSLFEIDHCLCGLLMFNSETGLWTRHISRVPYRVPYRGIRGVIFPPTAPEVALRGDGVLYWLVNNPYVEKDNPERFACVLSFDPFRSVFGLVPIPDVRFSSVRRFFRCDKLQLGVVRGRLWLSRLVKINAKTSFVLIVWELDDEMDSWRLVHDVALGKCWGCSELRVLAFDPIDGNVVYLMRDGIAYSYEIGDGKYEKVRGFPYYRNGSKIKRMNDLIAGRLRAITLVHSLWPMRLQI